MSTKLYHGFRFRTRNVQSALEMAREFRRTLAPLITEKAAAFVAGHAVREMDRWLASDGPVVGDFSPGFLAHLRRHEARLPDELLQAVLAQVEPHLKRHAKEAAERTFAKAPNFLSEAWQELEGRRREVKRTGRRDTEVDFGFEISVIPMESGILGYVFSEQSDFRDLWRSHPLVEDYAYWDNTDPDGSVSAEAWEQRERDWDTALTVDGRSVPFSVAGFSLDLVDPYLPHPEVAEILRRVPPFERRLEKLACGRVLDRRIKEEWERQGRPDRDFSLIFGAQEWTETPEGRSAVAAERARLEPLLPREVTDEHLRGRVARIPPAAPEPPKPSVRRR
jgi:hypothetical protein